MSIAPTEEATRILEEWNRGDANAAGLRHGRRRI